MSLDRSDDKITLTITGGKEHDFTPELEVIEQVSWEGLVAADTPPQDSAFTMLYLAGSLLIDSPEDASRVVSEGSLPSNEQLRALLREDLDRVRERLAYPERYERTTENYDTFGYGFEYHQVAEHVLLVGTSCEAWLAAGEVEPKDEVVCEELVFTRLSLAGIFRA
jgi:hypothetical protein